MINILILLVFWHFLADFPLQGDFLARFKDPKGRPGDLEPNPLWAWCLAAHCFIQAGGAYLITGSLLVFALEFAAHAAIDYAKCRGHLSFAMDQVLHLGCKVLWVLVLVLR